VTLLNVGTPVGAYSNDAGRRRHGSQQSTFFIAEIMLEDENGLLENRMQRAKRRIMSVPLQFVFYFAVKPEKVWDGLVSPESNRIIFAGADFEADLRPGGSMRWIGPGGDGKPTALVNGEILRCEPPRLLEYTFQLGQSALKSRVTAELQPETEATKLTITHDQWDEADLAYAFCSDGWPRILSRLKTLLETGKTFRPH